MLRVGSRESVGYAPVTSTTHHSALSSRLPRLVAWREDRRRIKKAESLPMSFVFFGSREACAHSDQVRGVMFVP